ncbi:MAG: hypothetical protein HRU34_12470 [Richelia sp.]|nr:hypothetical protein [Richelia sp.]
MPLDEAIGLVNQKVNINSSLGFDVILARYSKRKTKEMIKTTATDKTPTSMQETAQAIALLQIQSL